MADLSTLFAPQPFQTIPENVNPFELHAPKAAEFKRRIALREAMKAGISPQNQREFVSFMGQRLAQLNDGEGATMMAQQLQALDQQELENQQSNRRLDQFDTGLDIQAENALTNRMNATRPANKALKEVYNPETGRNEWVLAEDAVGMESARKDRSTTNNINITNIPEGYEPTKPTKNALQKVVVDTSNQLGRLQQIADSFDADMLTFQGRVGDMFRRGKDYFGKATPQEKAEITRHARLRQTMANQVNMTIKELSGVAVSVQEAKRLQLTEAWYGDRNNPLTGMAGAEAKAQLQGKLRDIAAVHARARYMLKTMNVANGTRFTEEEIVEMAKNDTFPVAYEDMPRIMDARIDELIKAGYEDAEIEQLMIDEFGMVDLPRVGE
jgi:hypothetical protein